MSDDSAAQGHPEPSKSSRSGHVLWMLVPAALVSYLLSPAIPAALYRRGVILPEEVLVALYLFWRPLVWFVQSGLPGGAEYNDLINWIAGE